MKFFDHIIIGGGVIGTSIAWHLTRYSDDSVLLLERNEIASAASSQAAGLLLQVTNKFNHTPLSKMTFETIPLLEDKLDTSLGFHQVGSIRIATQTNSKDNLDLLAENAAAHHIPCELINAENVRKMIPWLHISGNEKLVYFPTDGYIDPYLITMAYAKAARKAGAVVRPRSEVKSILHQHGRVNGVLTNDGAIQSGNVIVAAGAWSAVLCSEAGYGLPLAPVRSHYWTTESDSSFDRSHPITILIDAAAYTRPELGGLLIGIQEAQSTAFDARQLPHDPASFSLTTDEKHWDTLIESSKQIAPLFPRINQTRFNHYLAGLSTYTPDGQFILGEIPGISGLLTASGCCGSGIMLSAGIGAAAASLLLEKNPPFELSPYRPDRFGQVDPFEESFRIRCAQARSKKTQNR